MVLSVWVKQEQAYHTMNFHQKNSCWQRRCFWNWCAWDVTCWNKMPKGKSGTYLKEVSKIGCTAECMACDRRKHRTGGADSQVLLVFPATISTIPTNMVPKVSYYKYYHNQYGANSQLCTITQPILCQYLISPLSHPIQCWQCRILMA